MASGKKEKSAFLQQFVDHNKGKSNHMLSGVLRIAQLALLVGFVLAVGIVYFATRSISLAGDQKIVHYVVERDSATGGILSISTLDAHDDIEKNDLWVMGDLERFIMLIRSSSVDIGTIKRNLIEAEKMLITGSQGQVQVKEWISNNDVYARMVSKGEYIIPKSFVKRKQKGTEDTYVLSWVETVKDVSSNKKIRVDHYRAEILVEFRKTNSQEVFEGNPLGLYIKSITTDLVNSIKQ